MLLRGVLPALTAVAVVSLASLVPGEPASAATAGLVAAYSFDENAGSTAGDASGLGNTGVVSGATWSQAGRFGSALTFDGIDDWMTVADSAALDVTRVTLSAWVRPASLPSRTFDTILLKERGTSLSYALYANSSTDRPSGHVYVKGDRSTRGTSQLPLAWTHLALTFDGSTISLYVQGVLASTRSQSGSISVGTGPLRLGGNSVFGEYFHGLIDEVRVYNRALSVTEIQADMTTPIGSPQPPPPDTTPPTVTITAPPTGSVVSGSVTVTAAASDASGISGVRFAVDGQPLGAEDTTAPYTASWDTGTSPSGTHTLTATARDAVGLTTVSAGVDVLVQAPTGDPSVVGRWEGPLEWPLVPVHMMLLPNGNVLMYDGFAAALGSEREWNPTSRTFQQVPYTRNLFCSAQVTLADGRALVVGGHVAPYDGLADLSIYDPVTRTWTRGPDMARGRWYPTATVLADGRVLVVSGDNIARRRSGQPVPLTNASDTVPEIYDPATNTWRQLPSASRWMPLYPFLFVLPDGTVFDAGPDQQTRVLDLGTGTWSQGIASPIDGHSAVMYRPGKILKSGTWSDPDFPGLAVHGRSAVVDMTVFAPAWREVQPMTYPRGYHTLTVLPDGNVLSTGGGRRSDGVDLSSSVLEAELWNAQTETWSTMAPMRNGRLYHSSALLLPDGRVLVAGGGQLPSSNAVNQRNAEIFSPPYLFRGPRPVIGSAPGIIDHGSSFSVATSDAARIATVALVRFGSVTHNLDMDQRYVSLSFTRGNGVLTVQAPASRDVAPPGHYMLFLVDSDGVPSISSTVRLPLPGAADTTPPAVTITAPTGGEVSGTVAVNASASDNIGVVGVQFKLDDANLGTEDTTAPYGTSWSTTATTNGAHILSAVARDASGNVQTSSLVAVTVSNMSPPPPPPSGLVAAYGFGEGAGVSVTDASGRANHGVVSGATWTPAGRFGGALSFDGSNDWVTVASAPSLDVTRVTVSAWVNPTSLPSGSYPTLVMRERGASLSYALYGNSSTNRPSGHVFVGADRQVLGTARLALGTWTHLAVTFDGSAVRLYADGVLVGTRVQSGSIATGTGPLRLGGNGVFTGEFFHGLVDEVRVYDRALGAAEIQADMATAVSP